MWHFFSPGYTNFRYTANFGPQPRYDRVFRIGRMRYSLWRHENTHRRRFGIFPYCRKGFEKFVQHFTMATGSAKNYIFYFLIALKIRKVQNMKCFSLFRFYLRNPQLCHFRGHLNFTELLLTRIWAKDSSRKIFRSLNK